MIRDAIIFATKKHNGQYRKGTDIPYIVHPIEVMQILMDNKCSIESIIGGILHDTLEDTKTDYEEIEKAFGTEVANLVLAESEHKAKPWRMRKQDTINALKHESIKAKEVCCADKLSNLSSIFFDLQVIGDEVWKKFKADKSQIMWYYKGVIEGLNGLENYDMYKKLCNYFDLVFGCAAEQAS